MDLSKLIGRKQEPQPEENRLSKEEYAALKKAEREELWAKVDNQARRCFPERIPGLYGGWTFWPDVPRRAPGIC